MSKIAFMFPGQGSQYSGMGKDFYENSEKIRNCYAQAETILKVSLKEKIFSGNGEALKETSFSQLAITLTSYACYRMLAELNVFPEAMAGHSLGEYSALICAGVFSFSDGLKLVQKRSFWMSEASRKHPGKMAAILGLPAEEVENVCLSAKSKGVVSIANFNSPRQTVISGESLAVEEGVKLAQEKGAKRVVNLAVSGPFHTELMAEAGDKLSGILDSIDLISPRLPIVNNVNANMENTPAQIKNNLVKQVSQPVRWTDSIKELINQGFDTFVEVGPRRVLSGLLSQIDKKVVSLNIEDNESLEETKRALEGDIA